jgi:hypothetical protein
VKTTNCQNPPYRGSRVRFSRGKFEILPYIRTMNKPVINDRLLYLNAPKMALDFLVENLGFVILGYAVSKIADGVNVCDSYGNLHEVFLNIRKDESGTPDFKLIINTKDCLHDFYQLRLKHVSIITKPHYLPEGLAFEISDYCNNRYIFLEKRDYTDP